MKHSSTIFLKAVVLLIGLPVLAICIFWLPGLADIYDGKDSEAAYVLYPVFICAYASAISFFFALYQAFRLLGYIDKNTAFSSLSVKALKKIKFSAVAIGVLYGACMPFLYFIAEADDAPGLIVIGLVIIFASAVIAAFAAVLEMLLKSAMEIKMENDLTV
ncbi:DUF2975 domain-containing protein [Parasporobacterium paucivorans]|uniref:DUF2975 domain-containing protein n=1 Tax=Parasporobacterium paucivorans DSM 15970 TaxID=1122934 RepID=A0A1M6JII8_9FIRM|nr:DUF2975 domain-containing protein [Parasporobacterium paucivorans]SHJ46473.1 Protein of unknown function [Parasporobacterium paucivorans DSM 15970]